ncbi:unnamed protein product [Strongylus vulgaris]|uniref:Uncharacterized protein n=1 Tax=Strongylus vulgaris TaxID=40348 RepID=A0A3P7J3Y9_STRVU|nr:unnamed protein product [Strongylus vulgaris]
MQIAILLAAYFYTTSSLPTKTTTTTRKPSDPASDEYEDDGESWECGTDDLTKYLSENQIDLDCPSIKSKL